MPNPLKNKHLITAMLVAPILAVIAYFATDYLVAERPHSAKAGGSYPLVALSNCRYESGVCTLKNAEVKLEITAERLASNKVKLVLTSELPLQKAVLAFSEAGVERAPVQMEPMNDAWLATLAIDNPKETQLRFAAVIDNVNYFVETEAIFVDYETSFSRENFSE
ncbi:hypothetical protein P886_0839 [Alteromonadaceae bacterium 2753L.S.0a.02]|nr:hypothetical protein P886_0839 [Alteromonadaceae bacterium 2753L.S.0a.02]